MRDTGAYGLCHEEPRDQLQTREQDQQGKLEKGRKGCCQVIRSPCHSADSHFQSKTDTDVRGLDVVPTDSHAGFCLWYQVCSRNSVLIPATLMEKPRGFSQQKLSVLRATHMAKMHGEGSF